MKKAIILKLMCVFVAALLALSLLAACTENKEGEDETTTVPGYETSPEETTPSNVDSNGYILDTVPTDTLGYGGRAVTLLYWSDVEHEEFVSEKQTGEPVNDAIFLPTWRLRTGSTSSSNSYQPPPTPAMLPNG